MKYTLLIFLCILFLTFPSVASPINIVVDLDNNDSFTKQTLVGSVLTQAIKETAGADVAFLCSSSINGKLSRGSTDSSSLWKLLYYPDDQVLLLELTGQQIKDIMEKSISSYPGENGDFLQVAGLSGTFDAKRPSGDRVVELYIGSSKINLQGKYKAAVDQTLAGGFSGYIIFTQGQVLTSTTLSLRQILERYALVYKTIEQPVMYGLVLKR